MIVFQHFTLDHKYTTIVLTYKFILEMFVLS